jgi:hypothetical protein
MKILKNEILIFKINKMIKIVGRTIFYIKFIKNKNQIQFSQN